MSFRARLALFFVLIVAVPITAIALLASALTDDSQAGKADAQLATALEVTLGLHGRMADDSRAAASRIARDGALQRAVVGGDEEAVRAALADATAGADVAHVAVELPGGQTVEVPAGEPFAAASVTLAGAAGGAELTVSAADAAELEAEASELTGLEVSVVERAEDAPAGAPAPDGEPADTEDGGARAVAAELPASAGATVLLTAPVESGGFFDSQPAVAAALVAFLVGAAALIALVVRTLQGQVAAMLAAARRIGEGDLSARVPVVGRDEMAGLAQEFNRMSERLEAQIEQLQRQQKDLDRSVRRLGEAFAAGLDRDALLAIVADTARESCNAEYCRIMLADGVLIERPEDVRGPARDAAVAGERRSRRETAKVAARREDGHALSAPLRRMARGESEGTISVARRGRPFGEAERNMFLYLLGQASASMENIATHEVVSELAVTDELTGLPNSRAFREAVEREAARAQRFGHELSLLILDIDDFKRVNDTYGHMQGDEVLRMVGRVLADETRAIDEPARYGGEEFVVALPETSLQGATEIAERIRARIEGESVRRTDGGGELRVTASFGVASAPGGAGEVRELFSAADEALYEAKRSGKNRVVGARARKEALSGETRQ